MPNNFPAAIHGLWRTLLPVKRADAVVFLDSSWMLSLYSAAWRAGIRVGAALDVIGFDYRPVLEWLDPPPRMLKVPVKRMVKRIQRWLDHPERTEGFERLGITA